MKFVYLVIGWAFVVVGLVGIFLPILPTTPFALVAAYCFSKGSPRWHAWLLARPILGPLIVDWERDGVIAPRAKVLATVMMVLLFAYTLVFVPVAVWVKVFIVLIAIAILVFIWSRPSFRKPRES